MSAESIWIKGVSTGELYAIAAVLEDEGLLAYAADIRVAADERDDLIEARKQILDMWPDNPANPT